MVRRLEADLVLDAGAVLGECPVWSPKDRRLRFLDIDGQELWDWEPVSSKVVARTALSARVTAFAPSRSDRLVAATETGLGWLEPDSGEVIEFIQLTDPVLARMNDGAVDPLGRFWAGSSSVDGSRFDGCLYVLDADMHSHTMLTGIGMSNGLGWLNDGSLLLHVDTAAGMVSAYDIVERRCGPALTNKRVVVAIPESAGLPDGLAVDESGAFWLAVWGTGEVRRYTITGELDTVVETGALNTSSCCFGNSDLSILFITSARQGIDEPRREDGGLFAVEPGVHGTGQMSFSSQFLTGSTRMGVQGRYRRSGFRL